MKDELTDKMHSEFTIDKETEISNQVGTVCQVVHDKDFTFEEALKLYGVTLEQYNKYSHKWLKLMEKEN